MSTHRDILPKLRKQVVYLENTLEKIVVRFTPPPDAKVFAKAKGKQEFETTQSTEFITDTLLEAKEITQEQYNKF